LQFERLLDDQESRLCLHSRVVPLVLATGAGANARKSIGITVFFGMIASTCLAVLFVPTFFVVVQRSRIGSASGAGESGAHVVQTPGGNRFSSSRTASVASAIRDHTPRH